MKAILLIYSVLRSAIMALSIAICLEPTAVPAQRAGAQEIERPSFNQWTTYLNPKYAYQVPVPPRLRAQNNPRKGGGCRFASEDGAFQLKVWGTALTLQPGDPLEGAWREAVNLRSRRIDFQRRSADGFVLSGANADGTEFYEKIILGMNAIAGMNVSYPMPLAAQFAPWVDEIERGLQWHEGAIPSVQDQPLPRRTVFDNLRNYFTGEDETQSSRWNQPIPDRPDRTTRTPREVPASPKIQPDPDRTKIDLTPPSPQPKVDPPAVAPLKPSPSSAPAAEAKPSPLKREDLPYGIAIPGKKGYVYSPFAENKQQVDVTNIPTGTKVKCPYTGKVFRVP